MQRTLDRLWLANAPLVLASRSKARIAMLTNAGIPVEIVPADIDERAVLGQPDPEGGAKAIALTLAREKALAVSGKMPDRLVLGADQTLDLNGEVCAKVSSRAQAASRLRMMSGHNHSLHSAFCLVRNGEVVTASVDSAEMWLRELSEDFVDAYLDATWPQIKDSVAVYEIEGLGIQIFERIDGDWFTIQGLPLRKVIAFLQNYGWLLV